MAERGQQRRLEVVWEGLSDRYARAKVAQVYRLLAPASAEANEEEEGALGAGVRLEEEQSQ
jgi:hypothetical protein